MVRTITNRRSLVGWACRNTLSVLPVVLCSLCMPAYALPLINEGDTVIDANVEIGVGAFHNSQDYSFFSQHRGRVNWQEGYIKAALSAHRGSWYGGISGIGTATIGNGDAAGFTRGNEHGLDLEDAYLGWKNDTVDISVGSQNFVLGDGFLIAGDQISLGTGIPNAPEVNRGGAYWLGARKAFRRTVILRMESGSPLRGDVFWLQSNNAAQSSTALSGMNIEWADQKRGTLGASWFKILYVNANEFLGSYAQRDNMQVFNVRGHGNLGIEPLFLAAGYVQESFKAAVQKNANAWYSELGYTFQALPFSPSINYRYSHFSETYDPLFYGFTRGYGTWFQGEVAANYAGPFSSNANIQEVAFHADTSESLGVGALVFIFDTDVPGPGQSKHFAREMDIYAEWSVSEHLWVSPLFGRYTPTTGFVGANKQSSNYLQIAVVYNL